MSKDVLRCVKSDRCQVTVGELYRWILAKLSDKDIKRALHKYRDLMPRQSDWNRKLTQATNTPELGFRYLYRCGQIDETNHRTMQKMLKYIDRQDVLPYFDTILYNTNNSNSSIEQLRNGLLDKVTNFISLCDMDSFNDVFGLPYTISQCQPLSNLVLTRSARKRLSTGDCGSCLTFIKKAKLDSEDTTKLSPKTACGQSKLTKDLTDENFATRVMACLKQSRQRYRNIPLLNSYSLPGVIEAPIQILLHTNNTNPKTQPHNQSQTPPRTDGDNLDQDNNDFDNLKDVYSKQNQSDLVPGFFYAKIRIMIRMDSGNYLAELDNLQSSRTEPLDRQMDIISQTSIFLRDREAGEMICELRCTDLDQVECLWRDYQTGMLKKRLSDMLFAAPESNTQHFRDSVPYVGGVIMPNLNLHIFISRYEYESCRAILMRNLRPVYVRPQSPQTDNKFPLSTANLYNRRGINLQSHPDYVARNNNVPESGANSHTNNINNNPPQHGFSAVQHLVANFRNPSQMNIWPFVQPQISVANRPVLMRMFYPNDNAIPVTVDHFLRQSQITSTIGNVTAYQQTYSRNNQ